MPDSSYGNWTTVLYQIWNSFRATEVLIWATNGKGQWIINIADIGPERVKQLKSTKTAKDKYGIKCSRNM